ncbi:M15 family metallopeptidase, partial [Eubacteriales bacterium OttesenSCG-928-A19]|nr:M15 family metallopeptidase [Eubacteriales bacterium OttesenSCG-928-A19]
ARYATWDNFTGRPVDGYRANRIVGSDVMADALREARDRAAALGYGLLLWDGYRPQRAVDCFLRWAALPEDGNAKARFYPNIARSEMVSQGYVAAKSGHSRGSAVDLTLYRLDTDALVPMGTDFDFMDERSHHGSGQVPADAARNRELLLGVMERSGFEPYAYEWWHYLLKDEPYPDAYFDFPIESAAR